MEPPGDMESGASTPDKGSGKGNGATASAPAAASARGQPASSSWPLSGHYWEDAIMEGHPMSDKLRHSMHYHGVQLPLLPSGRAPLLLAAVHGTDHHGRPFRWVARRHRKVLAQEHACPTPPPPLSWAACLDVRAQAGKLGWWVALLFTLGSALFIVSGVAGEFEALADPTADPAGLRSPSAALLRWPNLVAANLCFFPAGIMQYLESVNMDRAARLRAWKAGGGSRPRPRPRLLPTGHDFKTVSLWAVVIQLTGMLGFNLATIGSIIDAAILVDPTTVTWLVSFGFTYGGAAFTVSAVMMCWEATGSWWRGLVPSRLRDLRSVSWHAAFWNFQGSVGFLIGGAALYATSFSWTQMQWISGYGNLAGALWFEVSALAMLLEQGNPQHP
ncbi:hypothetical protein ABPG77_004504 [Micractinium sp. CCAP 211/92]